MITFTHKGDFKNCTGYLEKIKNVFRAGILDKYAQKGVEALKAATPVNTGRLANSWYYKIEHDKRKATITWCNDDIENGYNVAILVQYGHGEKGGGYVQGQDFINPAILPVIQEIADEVWKEVTNL